MPLGGVHLPLGGVHLLLLGLWIVSRVYEWPINEYETTYVAVTMIII